MKESDIVVKASFYAEFLILHLGLNDATLYADVFYKHVQAKIDSYNLLGSESIKNFNEIKSKV